MKYKLKKDIPYHKLNTLEEGVKEKLLKGESVELDYLPRVLIGKVKKEIDSKPKKKIKKENN